MTRTKFKQLVQWALPDHLTHDGEGRETKFPKKTLDVLQTVAENHAISVLNQYERMKREIADGHLPSCLILGRKTFLNTDVEELMPVYGKYKPKPGLKSFANANGMQLRSDAYYREFCRVNGYAIPKKLQKSASQP